MFGEQARRNREHDAASGDRNHLASRVEQQLDMVAAISGFAQHVAEARRFLGKRRGEAFH